MVVIVSVCLAGGGMDAGVGIDGGEEGCGASGVGVGTERAPVLRALMMRSDTEAEVEADTAAFASAELPAAVAAVMVLLSVGDWDGDGVGSSAMVDITVDAARGAAEDAAGISVETSSGVEAATEAGGGGGAVMIDSSDDEAEVAEEVEAVEVCLETGDGGHEAAGEAAGEVLSPVLRLGPRPDEVGVCDGDGDDWRVCVRASGPGRDRMRDVGPGCQGVDEDEDAEVEVESTVLRPGAGPGAAPLPAREMVPVTRTGPDPIPVSAR
jgi:hypothetical protein